MKKQVLTVLTAASLLFVAACGSKDGIDTSKSAEDIMAKTIELNQDVESVEASATATLSMNVMGYDMDTDIEMEMVNFMDPMKSKVDMKMDMAGTSAEATSYAQMSDDGYDVYAEDGTGGWTKTTMDVSDLEGIINGVAGNATAYVKDVMDLNKEGEETIGDAETIKLSGSMSDNAMNEVMNSTDMADSYSELLGLDGFPLEFEGDMPITAWVEISTGRILKMNIDMTEVMQNYMDSLMDYMAELYEEDMSEEEDLFSISAYTMEILYSNYNEAQDFEIPEDVLAAE